MNGFTLDERLQRDCIAMGRLGFCRLLLMNNSAVPWFVLVPETTVTEIVDLDDVQRAALRTEIDRVCAFVREKFSIDKLNVAAIGNVVSQLHVHVVGRRKDDYCWPDVVWGQPSPEGYSDERLAELEALVCEQLAPVIAVAADRSPE